MNEDHQTIGEIGAEMSDEDIRDEDERDEADEASVETSGETSGEGEAASGEPVPMEVKGLMMDPTSNVPIVILRDPGSSRFLPIWIGVFEANAIALCLEEVEISRPLTHDLAASLVEQLGAEVEKIVVSDLVDSTFYAEIHLRQGDQEVVVDARPSDAIALALRVDAGIEVSQTVLEKAKTDDRTEQLSKDEKIRQWLEELDPDDLGEYTM